MRKGVRIGVSRYTSQAHKSTPASQSQRIVGLVNHTALIHRLPCIQRRFVFGDFLQTRQCQLSAQLLRTGVDAIDQAITFHPQQVATKGFEQAIQLREPRDIGPQDLQGDVRRGAWRNHIAWRQVLTDGQHYRVRQSLEGFLLSLAVALLVVEPDVPLRLPAGIGFSRMDRQQYVGIVALGRLAQRLPAVRAECVRRCQQLFGQIRQRQAQRQATVLRGGTHWRCAALIVAKQLGALDPLVQPPDQKRRPVRTPQRQAGTTQAALRGAWIEVDDDMVMLVTILADQLLRVLAQLSDGLALACLRIAGQAQQQGIESPLQRSCALLALLTGNRLSHLIQTLELFGLTGQ